MYRYRYRQVLEKSIGTRTRSLKNGIGASLVISYFYNDVTQLLTQLLFVRSN